MRWLRFGLGIVGLVGGAFVLAIVGEPAVAERMPIDQAVARRDRGYLLVAGVGSLALVAVAFILASRVVYGIHQATPPTPESPSAVPTPGDSLDAFIEGDMGVRELLGAERGTAVKDRLRTAAIRSVMRTTRVDRETARQRVERGEWTDDPTARAYLAAQGSVPLRTRAVAMFRGQSAGQYGASRAAAAISRLEDRDR